MSNWFSPLLFVLAGSTEQQLRRQIEFLKAENEILRAHIPKQRLFLKNEERERLLKLGDSVGKGVLQIITIVSPRTYQRWQRRVSQGQKPAKKMGRKGTPESLREIVVRLAKETGWGYGRIVGELKKLRIHCVGRTTVRTILKEEAFTPARNVAKGPGTSSSRFTPRPCGRSTSSAKPSSPRRGSSRRWSWRS